MGPAILHAALSTFLGVCFTILGQGFVWQAFFTLWSTVVAAGFLYSTWILPVMLTMIGPENKVLLIFNENNVIKENNIDKDVDNNNDTQTKSAKTDL